MTDIHQSSPIPPEFLELLACPACENRPPVQLTSDYQYLQCPQCRRKYPIMEGGIPKMLIDEAILDPNELKE